MSALIVLSASVLSGGILKAVTSLSSWPKRDYGSQQVKRKKLRRKTGCAAAVDSRQHVRSHVSRDPGSDGGLRMHRAEESVRTTGPSRSHQLTVFRVPNLRQAIFEAASESVLSAESIFAGLRKSLECTPQRRCGGMVDATDLKSVSAKRGVWVRLPSSALLKTRFR